jgi:hypothetical protein
MTMRLMGRALQLAERGWYVFPLRPGDKKPLPGFTKWESRATRDPEQIMQWWATAPCNIGIATGRSRLLVIDCDTQRGTDDAQWRLLGGGVEVAGHRLPRTFTARTPSGGLHLYFAAPGQALGNTAGKLGRHVDTRGLGGYVVGPGSVCSGRLYVVVDRASIARLPTWITALLVPRQPSGPPTAPTERITGHNLKAILQGEVERVRSARPGRRNHALNTAAFIMGQLVGSGEITEEHAWSLLRSASQRHIGVHGFTESELERTTRSGLSAGMRRPRWIHQEG